MSHDRELFDLHRLVKQHGASHVADIMHCSERQLTNLRAGINPLTIDHLRRLKMEFPEFDLTSTVIKIGLSRKSKGRAS